jgi:hypothetical protein
MTVYAAASSWDDPAWADFFPEGMPTEWRLTYYANEFRAVLATPDMLPQLAEAADELPDTFRLFVDLRDGAPLSPEWLAPFAGRVGGILASPGVPSPAGLGVLIGVVADRPIEPAPGDVDSCWPGGHHGPGRFAWVRAEAADPRALRAAVEQAKAWAPAGTGLVELGAGGPEALRTAQTVIELLGV